LHRRRRPSIEATASARCEVRTISMYLSAFRLYRVEGEGHERRRPQAMRKTRLEM
jgi:hypothetical protein